MNESRQNEKLDELLKQTLARQETEFDFDKWKQSHTNDIEAYQNQTAGASARHRSAIWRIIMHSKMTKLAASILVIGVLLYMVVGEKGVSKAYALEQVLKNIENVPWMHSVSKMKDVGGTEGESWHSFAAGITGARSKDGTVLFIDNKAKDMYIYSPDANEITAMASPMSMLFGAASPYGYFKNLIRMLGEVEGAQAASRSDVLNGRKVEILQVRLPGDDTEGMEGEVVWRFFVDEQSNLPLRGEVSKYDGAGVLLGTGSMIMDYPESGPDSIYALGVPRNARVIDDRAGPGIDQLVEIFRVNRRQFTSYVLIHVQAEASVVNQVDITYVKGDTFKAGKHFKSLAYHYAPETAYWRQIKLDELCAQIENDIGGFHKDIRNLKMFAPPSMDVWDGKNRYWKNREESVKKSRSPGSNFDVGLFWPIGASIGAIISNDYSTSHGLVAIKTAGMLRYFDPTHDYVCVRSESKSEVDTGMKLLIREVEELAQTESRRWYPRTEKGFLVIQDENGREISRKSAFTMKYYVLPLPNLPDSFFDKSRILGEDVAK